MAEAFLQTATQAPQPMQAAASMARPRPSFGTGMALPSGAPPVFTETKPPAWMMRSNALRFTTRSLTGGKAFARQGSMVMVCAVIEMAHVKLAGGGAVVAAVRDAVDHQRAHAADAFAAIGVKGDRFLAFGDQPFVHHVEHFEERHVLA